MVFPLLRLLRKVRSPTCHQRQIALVLHNILSLRGLCRRMVQMHVVLRRAPFLLPHLPGRLLRESYPRHRSQLRRTQYAQPPSPTS